MRSGWLSALDVPGWEALPRATQLRVEEVDGQQIMEIRTGELVSTLVFGEPIGWRTNPALVEAAWQRLMLTHWWRLAHARAGYS